MLARENIRLLRSENPYRNGLQELNKKEKKTESNEKENENKKYKKTLSSRYWEKLWNWIQSVL